MTQDRTAGYFDADAGDPETLRALIGRRLDHADVPHAATVTRQVPIYDMHALAPALADQDARRALMAEWAWVLRESAGVIVLRGSYGDTGVIDRATDVFNAIIAAEAAQGAGKGDHFAASGANDRIWNALQKLCLRDPACFAGYFANDAIAAVCEAWLGPAYQMTAQVNQVRPGGKAQQAHRDYHLGFQSAAGAARYPVHAHDLTAALTLQGGIAHCDMPIESGPTKLLPFSQLYSPGYVAFHDPAHRALFEDHCIQLPLAKGDVIFFNPALFHAAGENRSADIARMVMLLQVSSAFGRAMESVDRAAMVRALYPVLSGSAMTAAQVAAVIAASAEGYAFPTNLDTDPPLNGNAPVSQADILRRALTENWPGDRLDAALTEMDNRRCP
ncbi:Ectoine hydroxylase-related dioxygenase, phytanoyl-CoA dioxygenase (PhyH) family [Loktanella sp. DSM 29012]|uniref:phytanoyl-CoA dioxygenase family protein n=1 Tax=Loktanella sp. DSM 29012 TaxID=1881056 RepID=UPI0008BA0150|nr:phytanoyl-CoA dioxygenase family protein [Loktanella sp. DSM 29012]SEQ80816.1 Ectoine hydroxylase-related dioxygenase, phytanoyl-CoA dioxygenase (PhyH) family [Loktanella sp. DSM 29012]